MKFIIIASLISLAVASPVAVSSGSAAVSKNDVAARLFARAAAVISCEIVNTSSVSVNCRSGPTLGSSVTDAVYPGVFYDFSCYKTGDCYNGICTWDKTGGCYVNGYYTDSHCTSTALPKCK